MFSMKSPLLSGTQVQQREQNTSSPSGAAKTLLKIAVTNPDAVREALRSV